MAESVGWSRRGYGRELYRLGRSAIYVVGMALYHVKTLSASPIRIEIQVQITKDLFLIYQLGKDKMFGLVFVRLYNQAPLYIAHDGLNCLIFFQKM